MIRRTLHPLARVVTLLCFVNLCALVAHADPISGSVILTSLVVSAATTAASFITQRLLTPKPKGVIRGQQQGSMQLSDSTYNVPIKEIYGARYASDNIGGSKVGCNFIWANREGIREVRETVPASGGGSGKGPPKPPPETRVSYNLDLAGLVGHGPLNVLKIKFDQDTVYDMTRAGVAAVSRFYEGETAQLVDAEVISGEIYSSGQAAEIEAGGSAFFGDVRATTAGEHELSIYFNASPGTELTVETNGGAPQVVTLSDSEAALGIVSLSVILNASETNEILLTVTGAAAARLDRIFVYDLDGGGITGVLDDFFPADAAIDNYLLPDPYELDSRPRLRHSFVPTPNETDGSVSAQIVGGVYASMTIYEGNSTQEPDPVMAADVDAREGVENSCPAYLDECYIRWTQLNISKYNRVPQVTVTAEHKTIRTVADIINHRAQRSGPVADDLDMTEASNTYVRGFVIDELQPVKRDMDDLAAFFNLTFVEDLTGKIVARDLSSRAIAATLTEDDLGAYILGDQKASPDLVSSRVVDPPQLWERVGISYFNPDPKSDFQIGRAEDVRSMYGAKTHETFEFNITATDAEAMHVARRLMQKHWMESDPDTFTVQHRFAYLTPAQRIQIPKDGELQTVRIMEITGYAPGLLTIKAVPDDLSVIAAPRVGVIGAPARTYYPGNTVATFMDIPLLHPQALAGMYVAATPRDLRSGVWNGAVAWRYKGNEWQQMTTFTQMATMGRCVTALPEVPGGWVEGEFDTTSTVTMDLFANLEPPTFTDEQIADGLGVWVIGDEVCQVAQWTRDNSQPNRWVGSRIMRRLKGTEAASAWHVEGERLVLMNSAVRFIELDVTEKDIPRTWKVQTAGARLSDAGPISVTWTGRNIRSIPAGGSADSGVPILQDPSTPTVTETAGGNWVVRYPMPQDQAKTLMKSRVRFTRISDGVVVALESNGLNTSYTREAFAFDCLAEYGWQNQWRGATGTESDGWSEWSTGATLHAIGGPTPNPADDTITSFDDDPSDSRGYTEQYNYQ